MKKFTPKKFRIAAIDGNTDNEIFKIQAKKGLKWVGFVKPFQKGKKNDTFYYTNYDPYGILAIGKDKSEKLLQEIKEQGSFEKFDPLKHFN